MKPFALILALFVGVIVAATPDAYAGGGGNVVRGGGDVFSVRAPVAQRQLVPLDQFRAQRFVRRSQRFGVQQNCQRQRFVAQPFVAQQAFATQQPFAVVQQPVAVVPQQRFFRRGPVARTLDSLRFGLAGF